MNCNSFNLFFQNFANKAKLDIIVALQDGSKNVTQLCNCGCGEQSAVSHNLKKLCDCNIIRVEQKGRERIYSLNMETVLPLLKLVQKHVESNCPQRCPKK